MFVCDYGKIKLICGVLTELLTFKHNENFCKFDYGCDSWKRSMTRKIGLCLILK